jgi:DNA-binding NarL/FixJ family response regulator
MSATMAPKMARITIALADDHKLVREGIRMLLAADPTLDVVAEASDGIDALAVVKRHHPDVLLLDLRIPQLHGLDVIRQLRDEEQTRIIVLSMHMEEPYVVEALREGAIAYLPKDCTPVELIRAIHAVANGESYFTDSLRQKAMTVALNVNRGSVPTGRERSVLELAAQGKTSSEVATALHISRRTVEAHRANVMKKLSLKSQTDLVLYAMRQGIVGAGAR